MAKWCATYLPELVCARPALLAVLWIGLAGCAGRAADDGLPAVVDYNFHIKPIISDRCYACHGPDDEARQADLQLHEEDGAKSTRLTSGGRAVVPGSLRRSKLYRRISARSAEERMPPAETNLSVSEHERALIARWIEQGASWKPHWAFVPPAVPPIPEIGNTAWPRNEIDRFILDRLERHGLSPSPQAARETLLRRVTLDLTGLPPTLDAIDAFLADTSRQAYERAVDRLLTSPAYGEHMAAEWLDIARYADTHGYQADRDRRMWPWRDWVVSAFNDNVPFHEFGTWQLAGDLLPAATTEQQLATAFNRNHRQTNEGGSIEEEFRTEYVADRANTAATAFLGLTMECARCHDHKYDPISHEEYYRFFSFFSSIDESGQTSHFTDAVPVPALSLPDEAVEGRLERIRMRIAQAEASLQAARDMAVPAYERWIRDAQPTALPGLPRKDLSAYFDFELLGNGLVPAAYPAGAEATTVFDPVLRSGRAGRAITFDGENGAFFEGMGLFTAADPFTLSLWILVPRYESSNVLVHRTQAALDAGSRGYELSMEDGHLVAQLAHMWPENAVRIISEHRVPLSEWVHVAMAYDGSSRAEGLSLFMDGERQQVRTVRNSLRRDITYEDLEVHLTMGYRFRDTGFKDGRIDDFRLYARELTDLEVRQLAGQDALTPALGAPDEHELNLLEFYLALYNPPYAAALEELRNARREFAEAAADVPEIMVMREMDQPRPVHVLRRGVYDEKGDVVLPGTPEALGAFPDTLPHNRLGLARWIFSRDNPLTARVAVNRFWQRHFGTGLVSTAEDFGNQGALPSHPELLDYLAAEFIESGWDVKAMHRRIVTSATYRQSSNVSEELMELDPDNRLLARGTRLRLTAEMTRDQALAASGLLVRRLGGPPVKPYQPEGLWEEKAGISYVQDTGEDLYRRSLYTFFKRTSPPPSMIAFDMSTRSHCIMRRQQTTTPMQALVLLNDPQFLEAARHLAERMLREGGASMAGRAAFAFRLLTGRGPSIEEEAVLEQLYAEQQHIFSNDESAALSLLQTGDSPFDANLPVPDLAAATTLASALLSFDEVTSRY